MDDEGKDQRQGLERRARDVGRTRRPPPAGGGEADRAAISDLGTEWPRACRPSARRKPRRCVVGIEEQQPAADRGPRCSRVARRDTPRVCRRWSAARSAGLARRRSRQSAASRRFDPSSRMMACQSPRVCASRCQAWPQVCRPHCAAGIDDRQRHRGLAITAGPQQFLDAAQGRAQAARRQSRGRHRRSGLAIFPRARPSNRYCRLAMVTAGPADPRQYEQAASGAALPR